MVQIQAKSIKVIQLGHRGENEARQIIFDLADYVSTYGPGTARLLHQRDGDPAPYIVPAVQDGDALTWTVTDEDTAAPGTGKAELQWTVNNVLAKSDIWSTRTKAALDDGATAPPTGAEGWYQQLIAYIDSLRDEGVSEAQIAAAVEAYLEENPVDVPVTSVNGHTGAVQLTAEDVGALDQDKLQTGVNTALAQAKASGEFDGAPGDPGTDGITPTIGANGNWYLGVTDTGKPSRGEAGPAGADGAPGADGKSAYQYAQEGGYTGTEAEFAAKLAEEYIPNPPTASVGQTIVVKSVDENGKPTEWEAADMPSGSVGGQVFDEVVMLSEAVNEWSIDVPEGITDVTLMIVIPPAEADMTYGHILTNGAQSGFITMNWGNTSEERISGVSWLVFKNGTIGQVLAGNGTHWANADPFKKSVKDVTSLTSVGIKAYGAQNFPVGTTISVKGRS